MPTAVEMRVFFVLELPVIVVGYDCVDLLSNCCFLFSWPVFRAAPG